ncbi:unnamed protein product, partial [Prorocentrum cordatum]
MRALAAAGRLATGPGNRGRDPHVLAVALVALLAARQGCGAAAGRAFARRVQGRVGGRLRALRGGAAGVAKALGGQALGRAADPVLEGVAGLGGLAAGACEELGAFPADGRWGEGARGALAPALEAGEIPSTDVLVGPRRSSGLGVPPDAGASPFGAADDRISDEDYIRGGSDKAGGRLPDAFVGARGSPRPREASSGCALAESAPVVPGSS